MTAAAPLPDLTAAPTISWQTAEELRKRLSATSDPMSFRHALRTLVDQGTMETRITGTVREYRAKR